LRAKGVESLQKRRTAEFFERLSVRSVLALVLLSMGLIAPLTTAARSAQVDLRDEHDPGKRSEKLLETAEAAFDAARSAYAKDDVRTGDAQLDEMMAALQNCVSTLNTVHKSRLYKKAEMRVASLQRRLQSLLDEISITQRGWAEQTGRKLEEIHDKLLEGAMKK
jgi:hypothetical protein